MVSGFRPCSVPAMTSTNSITPLPSPIAGVDIQHFTIPSNENVTLSSRGVQTAMWRDGGVTTWLHDVSLVTITHTSNGVVITVHGENGVVSNLGLIGPSEQVRQALPVVAR